MKHVRATLDAGGREAEIHPMYDVIANAEFVDRATAIHWNFTGDELGIVHYVEGDPDAFADAAAGIVEVVDFEIHRTGDRSFYAYVRDATTQGARALFGAITVGSAVAIPPVEYRADGRVSLAIVGPSGAIQAAIDAVPEPVSVDIEEVGGLERATGGAAGHLSDRQREAAAAGLELGYYEIPREASHEDVAEALGCAPSTAAEHLRKAEAKLLRAAFD